MRVWEIHDRLDKLTINLRKQGKTDEQVKQAMRLFLDEMSKKITR